MGHQERQREKYVGGKQSTEGETILMRIVYTVGQESAVT